MTDRACPEPRGRFRALASRIASVAPARRLMRHFRRKSALAELTALDARTLKDVGLHRGELWFIADAYAREVSYSPCDWREQQQSPAVIQDRHATAER